MKLSQGLVVTEPREASVALDLALQQLDAWDGPFDRPSVGIALALLAAGRFENVQARLLHDTSDSVLPLLTARNLAWTGDIVTTSAVWDRIVRNFDALTAPSSGDDEDTVFRLASCTELQRAATDLGQRDVASGLTDAAQRLRTALAGRSLAEDTRRAGTLLGVGTRPGFNTDPDDGDVAAAALSVLGFVHGVLAIEPDAVRGRIRLQPHMRAVWSTINVPQIRFADGLVALHMVRNSGRTDISVAQSAGAVPYTALLEPVISGAVASTEVDGSLASLDVTFADGVSRVPVQLVLDNTRVLTLTLVPG
jgi:hypothetical protein